MQEVTFIALFNIMYEMLGSLLWPLVFVALFILFAFVALLFLERKIVYKRACAALIVGLLGGVVPLFILKGLSGSPSLVVVGGPIDLVVFVMAYLGGLFASATLIYSFIGWMDALKKGG